MYKCSKPGVEVKSVDSSGVNTSGIEMEAICSVI
jgi:hypothetical protein